MKSSKKILSLFLALLVLVSAFSLMLTVNAASGDIFFFQKPADWNDEIYVYWWSGSGAPSWPGVKMTKEGGSLYSFKATSTFTEFNINDGGSENVSDPHQTVNLKFPQNGQMGVITSSAGKNDYGNECWNLTWETLMGIGVNVMASVESCDFIDSIDVILYVTEVESGTYSINGGKETEYTDGEKITIGKDGLVGDKFTLTLKAGEGAETAEVSYTYTKTDSPVGASIVYFDNSAFNWENVYCYAYGTKENGDWPGQAMLKDSKSGLYYITFDSTYKSESIIINDGQDGDLEGSEQYPESGGMSLKVGQCKLLTKDNEWIDYGKPDSKPYGFAYIADGTKFGGDVLNVDIDLKNAVKGSYCVDGGAEFEYTERTTIAVGQGKIGNSEITLTLKAEGKDGTVTVTDIKYYKTFKATESGFYSPTDGSKTPAVGGNYATNPDLKLGKYSTSITVDGKADDWDSSMLIAQGVANDDPRVYMPSAIHERAVDDYALYASWDDENLYFMWEMANVSSVLGGDEIFSAQKPNGSIWNPGLPVYMLLSVDPAKHASGKARELDIKTDTWVESDSVWGSGLTFDTNIDTFIAFDSANTNGGAAIIPLDEEGFFNYTESVNIGRPTNDPGVKNRNGFEIAWDYGTLSDEVIGVNGYGSGREIGDSYSDNADWVNFFDEGYDADDGFIYEIKVPLEHLGIDREYIEKQGIGAMLVSTFGTSAMNTLPHDPSCLDNANLPYSYEDSTSHEKEDADNISVPLARVGALLSDTVIEEAPLELNFGADKSSAQSVGTELTLKAELYGTDEDYTVTFVVNGRGLVSAENTMPCTFMEVGTYELTATAETKSGKEVSKTIYYTIGEAVEVIIPPVTEPSEPVVPTKPADPEIPTTSPSTDPSESTTVVAPTTGEDTDPSEGVSTAPTESSTGAIIITPTSSVGVDNTTVVLEGLLLGDADDNGKINVKDATLIQRYAAKLSDLSEIAFKRSDVNSDDKVNVKDATAIQKFVAKIEVPYPIGECIS